MRRSLGIAFVVLGACSDTVLPIELDGSREKTAVVVSAGRADAFDVGQAFTVPLAPGDIIHTFAGDRAALRLGDHPKIVAQPQCAIDALDTSRAARTLCFDDAALAPCMPDPVKLEREPYLGEKCFGWDIDGTSQQFDLFDGGSYASFVTMLEPGRILAAQERLGGGSVISVVGPSGAVLQTVGDYFERFRSAVARDTSSAWITDFDGRLGLLSVATGTITRADDRAIGLIVDMVRSPADRDVVIAVTADCGIFRGDHGRWVAVSEAPHPDRCLLATLEWTEPDEALVANFFTAGRASSWHREIIRSGNTMTFELLPWPADMPAGEVTAVTAYRADDGARVELAVGSASSGAEGAPLFNVWFVRDPRVSNAWLLTKTTPFADDLPFARMFPWQDGALAVGDAFVGFSDAHWRAAPEAAFSREQVLSGYMDLVTSDGQGGLIVGSLGRTVGPYFIALRPR